MTPDELQKMRTLLDRMNEICKESQEIRAQIEALMQQRAPWPDTRRVSRLFTDIPPASVYPSPAGGDDTIN